MQLAGLEDGYYNKTLKPHINISVFGFLRLQILGDLIELERKFKRPKDLKKSGFSCSAFILPIKDINDIYVSHVTWAPYSTMLRMQKLYRFKFHLDRGTALETPITSTFSSYPGTLWSIDDFYLLSSGLAVTETTIDCRNESLLEYIRPENALLTWIRTTLANRLATDGLHWTTLFSMFNSGTYNNQWMIVNYKALKRACKNMADAQCKSPRKHIFFVLEQLPNSITVDDLTSVLYSDSYWPSFNLPYFQSIYNISGNLDLVKKYGDFFSYENSPRHRMFKRDWQKVQDMSTLLKLMRYNQYYNDSLSECDCNPKHNAELAISSRGDLNPPNGTYPFDELHCRSHGGTDVKVSIIQLYDTCCNTK
ncbi:unnamed protein product [Soboliphyme baturini]|uniref:Phospholipase B-like n=1 Tax=Soboliphyme baturini TaxID=241478 RepID=A0A183J0F3_9BILA|nr:unnamed protein product [Soboliphyme baturini]